MSSRVKTKVVLLQTYPSTNCRDDFSIRVDRKDIPLVAAKISPSPTFGVPVAKRKYRAAIVPASRLFVAAGGGGASRPTGGRVRLLGGHFRVITARGDRIFGCAGLGNSHVANEPD